MPSPDDLFPHQSEYVALDDAPAELRALHGHFSHLVSAAFAAGGYGGIERCRAELRPAIDRLLAAGWQENHCLHDFNDGQGLRLALKAVASPMAVAAAQRRLDCVAAGATL